MASEESEFWKEFRKEGQERKWKRYERDKQKLISHGVDFIEKANGHFIINRDGKPYLDYWGTTGLIIERKTKKRHSGINKILKLLNKERQHEEKANSLL